MKQKVNFLIAAMIGTFILSGCATVSEVEPESQVPEMQIPYFFYSFEVFRISLEHFQSLPWPTQAMLEAESYEEMFEAIVAAKEAWARYSVEHHGASTDTSENLYDFLIEHGLFSSEAAEEEIYFLDSVGNNIFVFVYAPDDNYVLIMYCQRLPSFEMMASLIGGDMATVIVVRGENVYTFSFQNVQYSNTRDDQIIHSTSQFRDLFERHLARILSDSYLRNY